MTPLSKTSFFVLLVCLCKISWAYPVLETNNLLENENLQNNLQAAAKAAAAPAAPVVSIAAPPISLAAPAISVQAPAISVQAPAISVQAPVISVVSVVVNSIPSAVAKSIPSLVQPSVVNVGNSNSQISAISLDTSGFSASYNTNVLPSSTVLAPPTTIITIKASSKPSIITSAIPAAPSTETKLTKSSNLAHQLAATQNNGNSDTFEKSKKSTSNENVQNQDDQSSVTEVVTENNMSKIMEVANFAMIIPMVAPLITMFDHGKSSSTIGYSTSFVKTTVQDPCSYVALISEGRAKVENQEEYSKAIQACSAKGGIKVVTKTENSSPTQSIHVVTVHATSTST